MASSNLAASANLSMLMPRTLGILDGVRQWSLCGLIYLSLVLSRRARNLNKALMALHGPR